MAYQNTVRGMQCRNIGGTMHPMGTGGYWECGSALIQLAQLVSRVTINQMEMAEHEYNIASQLNNNFNTRCETLETGQNTQIDRLSAIQNNQVVLDRKLNTMIQNQQTLSDQLETLVETLQSISGTLSGTSPKKKASSSKKETGKS